MLSLHSGSIRLGKTVALEVKLTSVQHRSTQFRWGFSDARDDRACTLDMHRIDRKKDCRTNFDRAPVGSGPASLAKLRVRSADILTYLLCEISVGGGTPCETKSIL